METKANAGNALRQFIRDFGVPQNLTSDGAPEQVGRLTDFTQLVRKRNIDHHITETGRPQQNRAETVIRKVK